MTGIGDNDIINCPVFVETRRREHLITIVGTIENMNAEHIRQFTDMIKKYGKMFKVRVNSIVADLSAIPDFAMAYKSRFEHEVLVFDYKNELFNISHLYHPIQTVSIDDAIVDTNFAAGAELIGESDSDSDVSLISNEEVLNVV